ncbi:nucleotidyl transferase AbiEii/AbiGii toxin family protein [Mycoplasmopsis felifaucium]|uniref:nucleotidyl transferase AbiEii/AbiGii toxin family protein n=1 Tax=Mycoplasmopsis felifaucium TaxID=35768 RepID=UPI000486EB45|nr:nucleotidyl transferase AbiEii/AbiGii toxin family protein [Mycoplasmopsis felifaucium]
MDITKEQYNHLQIIKDILKHIPNNYILKGGTALVLDYDLDRFSEDIDLDYIIQNHKCENLKNALINYCKKKNYSWNIKFDTNTKFKIYILYSEINKPIKIETSARDLVVAGSYHYSDGYYVYNLVPLARKKLIAFLGRSKFRDIYDILFLIKKGVYNKNEISQIKEHFYNNLDLDTLFEIYQTDNILKDQLDFESFCLEFENNIKKV